MSICLYCQEHTPPGHDECVHCGATLNVEAVCDQCGVDISHDIHAIAEGVCIDCYQPSEPQEAMQFDDFDDDDDIPF